MKKLFLPALLVLAAACSSDPPAPAPAPPVGPVGPAGFVADPGDGAAVVLRAKSASDKELVLEVVGQRAPALSGVAFRLSYDASVLKFRSMAAAPVWPAERVELASEAKPGLLLATVGVRGERAGAGPGDPLLATLTFDVVKAAPTPLAFVVERSTAYDDKGVAAALKWRGGALK